MSKGKKRVGFKGWSLLRWFPRLRVRYVRWRIMRTDAPMNSVVVTPIGEFSWFPEEVTRDIEDVRVTPSLTNSETWVRSDES